tara:strand:+ start:1014 stop:1433 length:420 start_codon:yes stop_codon:yes gene_type:complete
MGNIFSSNKKYHEFKNINNKNLLISNVEDKLSEYEIIIKNINNNIKSYSLSNITILTDLRLEISTLTNELNRNIQEQVNLKDNVKKLILINNNLIERIRLLESNIESNIESNLDINDMFLEDKTLEESSGYLVHSTGID